MRPWIHSILEHSPKIKRTGDCVFSVGNIQVHFHSSAKMPELDSDSVNLIVTSPPYKEDDGFSYRLMRDVFGECFRVLKSNGLLFMNFGHLAGHKHRPFRVAELCEYVGFTWVDTIVWTKHERGKGHFTPFQGNKRLNNLWEPIFMFSKGSEYSIDRLSIGVKYTDKSNIKRFNQEGDLRCRGNIWFIPYDTITSSDQKPHKDRFPLDLPRWCILLAALEPDSLILDPFCGSGTTLRASAQLGHRAVGYEVNEECIDPSLLYTSDALDWF